MKMEMNDDEISMSCGEDGLRTFMVRLRRNDDEEETATRIVCQDRRR
jgi:hypothetical protein